VTTPVSANALHESAERRRSPTDWLSIAYLVCVALFSVSVCVFAFGERTTVPIVDDWRILHDFYSMSLPEWLFSDQNGHRTAFTFALFALDYAFFGGRQDLLVIATFATAWLAVGILYLAFRTDRGLESASARAAFGFAWFATFWAGNSYNFFWGVCHGNLMVALWLFLALASLVVFVHGRPPWEGRWPLLAVGGLAALFATFSLGAGIGTWPALIAVAMAARLSRRIVFSLVAGFALTLAVYSFGVGATGTFSVEASASVLLHPLAMMEYATTFLGSALGRTLQGLGLVGTDGLGVASCALGAIGLAAAAIYGVALLRRPSKPASRELLALGIMTFAVAAALVVTAARLPRAPAQDAFSERFVNWSAMFWTGGVLALATLARVRQAAVSVWLIAALSVAMLPAMGPARASLLRQSAAASEASLGVMLGIRDAGLPASMGVYVGLPLLTSDPELVYRASRRGRSDRFQRVVDRLRRDRRGFFADPRASLPGTRLGDRFAVVSARRCSGGMDSPIALAGAVRAAAKVGGRARDLDADTVPPLVVITDASGTIRGLGAARRGSAAAKRRFGRFRWSGFVADYEPAERYRAYAVLSDGRSACRLSGNP
jgi:hypothetical protein